MGVSVGHSCLRTERAPCDARSGGGSLGEAIPTVRGALDAYFRTFPFEGRSAHCLASYRGYLKPLGALGEISIRELTAEHCRAVVADAIERGIKLSTAGVMLACIAAFGTFCVEQHWIATNPTQGIKRPKKRVPDHRWFDRAQLERLHAAAQCDDDALLVLILGGCGLRISELAGLRPEHVDFARRSLRVYGKGSKWREVPAGARALRLIELRMHRDGMIFSAGTFALRERLHRIARRARIAGVTPHRLRHSFAVAFLDASDGDALTLQYLMGHASLSQTEYYVRSYRQSLAVRKAQRIDVARSIFGD